MSNIVIIENIDSFEIVKGISKLQIDPVASKDVIQAELIKTDAYIVCKLKQDEMASKFSQAGDKLKESIIAKTKKNITLAKSLHREYKEFYEDALEIMQEVKSLLPDIEVVRKNLFETHAVYFQPGKRERIKSDAEISAIKSIAEDLPANKLIKSDGMLINNFSGMSFYHNDGSKWIKTSIDKIGVDKPLDSKLFNELSDTEKVEVLQDLNIKRISFLSISAKENEKQIELDKALISATHMRSGLEIQSDPEALSKSQQWYNNYVLEINELYK